MSADFTIDISSVDDAPAVSDVLAASYSELMRPSYDTELLERALPAMTKANAKLLASGRYYVARLADGAVVGCGGWSLERPGTTETEPGTAHVRHFAVRPGWTGCGVGRRIYMACEEQSRSQAVVRFDVFASLNSEQFYMALGFRRLEEIGVAMGPGVVFPSVWMRRSIGSTTSSREA
jgi:GNAT superfamily N-acetyltransferase